MPESTIDPPSPSWRTHPFSAIVLAACVVLYLVSGAESTRNGTRALIDWGALEPVRYFYLGEWWRLITAGFLHGSMLHILMNGFGLWGLGTQVEDLFGWRRAALIYAVSTAGGFWISLMLSSSMKVGASAGIFGLLGALIAYSTRVDTAQERMIRSHYLRWTGYNLAIGLLAFFPSPGVQIVSWLPKLEGMPIDNMAHIGGFACGFLAGYAAYRADDATDSALWRALGWAGCAALAAPVLWVTALRWNLV